MSFRELRNFTEVMRALGFPRLISMENFRAPNFPLVAEILVWLLNRYDPDVDIPKEINTEHDRVLFIRSVAQFMATKAHVKLNAKKLYQADGYAVKELLKITTLLYNAIIATKSLDDVDSYPKSGSVKSEITEKLQYTKLCRELASEITSKGATLYDLFGQEVDLRGVRSAALSRQIEINEVESWLKTATTTVEDEIKRTTKLIENVASDEANLEAKIEKKHNELDRNKKRLQALQKVRPAFMDDYERLEEELKRQYEAYVMKFRCLAYVEHLWGEYEWNEKEKMEQRETTMKSILEKMDESLNVDADAEDTFGEFDVGVEDGNAVKSGSRLQRPKPTARFATPGIRSDLTDARRKFGSMTGADLDESDSQLSDYDLELIDGGSKSTSDEEEVELDSMTTAAARKPAAADIERQGSDDDF